MAKISPRRKAAEDDARRSSKNLEHKLGSFRIISREADDAYWGAACTRCGAEVTYLASDPENTVGGLPMFQKCRAVKVPSSTR